MAAKNPTREPDPAPFKVHLYRTLGFLLGACAPQLTSLHATRLASRTPPDTSFHAPCTPLLTPLRTSLRGGGRRGGRRLAPGANGRRGLLGLSIRHN